MTNYESDADEMERRLERALEAVPVVRIPDDFAMRVAAQVPANVVAARRATPTGTSFEIGNRIAWVVAAVLLVAMFVLAPAAAASAGTKRWLEFALDIEFAALAVWLSLRRLLWS